MKSLEQIQSEITRVESHLKDLKNQLYDLNISSISQFDTAIVNAQKEGVYDLIMKYKASDQKITMRSVEYAIIRSIGYGDFINSIEPSMKIRYTLTIDNMVISFDNIDDAHHMGLFFFDDSIVLNNRYCEITEEQFYKKSFILMNVYIVSR